MTDVKCETCRWWRRHPSAAGLPDPSRYGNCHYHAPRPVFGTTQEDHFCRHHEAVAPVMSEATRSDGVTLRVGDRVEWTDKSLGVRSGVIEQINDGLARVVRVGKIGTYSMSAPLEYFRLASAAADTTEG